MWVPHMKGKLLKGCWGCLDKKGGLWKSRMGIKQFDNRESMKIEVVQQLENDIHHPLVEFDKHICTDFLELVVS